MENCNCFCKKMVIGGLAVGAVAMLVATGVASVSGLTYQTNTDVNFTFTPTLTVTVSDDLIISDLAPGTFADSNTVQVTVSTNNAYGYTLNATVGDTVNNLSNELRHSSYATSGDPIFSSIATDANLVRATFSSDSTYDNKWGFTASNDGTTWGNYNGLPVVGGENALELASSTYMPTNGTASKYVRIGARAGVGQASGTYTNTINFTAVAGMEPTLGPEACEAGKICYHPNAFVGTYDGTMGRPSATDGNTTTLLASNYSRNGYGFAGWNTAYDYSGTFYGPQEDITVPVGTTANGLSLYAVWVASAGSMQTDKTTVCNSLTTAPTNGTANLASVSALTDERDNQTYAIAKLADGNCWMIENLRLEAENTRTADKQALAQGYGTSATYGNFSGLADAESANFGSTTANNLYYSGTQEGTASIDIGTSNYPVYRMPRYNNLNTQSRAQNSPKTNIFSDNNTNGGMYSYGNYYTWHAAIADLTYNGTNNNSTTGTSLCPTGWRLPQGGNKTRIESNDDNDFWNLTVDALNGGTKPANYSSSTDPYYAGASEAGPVADKLRAYPNNFLYSGYFKTSSAGFRGWSGYYWSSTANNIGSSYSLGIGSSNDYPGTGNYDKSYGYSIRCLAP